MARRGAENTENKKITTLKTLFKRAGQKPALYCIKHYYFLLENIPTILNRLVKRSY
jgi:hypothetical protein